MELFELIRGIVAELLEIEDDMLEPDTKLEEYGADDLLLAQIADYVEEMFGVEFSNEEIYLDWKCIRNILLSVEMEELTLTFYSAP